MKIMMVIDTLQFGGAEKQLVFDANALSKAGHDVFVVSFCGGDLENELNGDVTCVQIIKRGYPKRAWALAALARNENVDIIHAHMFRAEVAGGLASLLCRKPVVFNEHGLGLWRTFPHRMLFRLITRTAREVWCASEYCRDLRVSFDRLPEKKCRTVYNAYTPFIHRDADALTLRMELLEGRDLNSVVIGFVGRFDKVKQLDLLVRAAGSLREPDVYFILVGDGPEMGAIKELIASVGLEDRFLLPGFVHNPSHYYSIFDVFVLPSKRESLSLALLEAGSSGVPSIAFNVGGNAEIIDHGITGLVVGDQTIEALVEGINAMTRDALFREECGAQAQKRVRELFSGEQRIANLLDGYHRVLGVRSN